jgi:hypothetical protein
MESLRSSGDFNDLLSGFNVEEVRYGRPRYTKDLDLWVDPTGDNPERVYRALARFGAALEGVNPNDFRDPDCVFQVGIEPLRVDILNDISGLRSADAWPSAARRVRSRPAIGSRKAFQGDRLFSKSCLIVITSLGQHPVDVAANQSHVFRGVTGFAKKFLALRRLSRKYLQFIAEGAGNKHFFLRAAQVARRFGFIATNTIGQGDTREVGLDALLKAAWSIGRAEKSRMWPGAAAIQVSEVWCHIGESSEPAILSGQIVSGISPLLVPKSRFSSTPFRLIENSNIAFIGSYILGTGFTMTPDRARELITHDIANRDVIRKYINAEDVCDRPDVSPRRWVIDFGGRGEQEASKYPECFEQVLRLVKPQRSVLAIRERREMWWRFASRSVGLYKALAPLHSVIVTPLHSKYTMPARVPSDYVYSHGLAVFASESGTLYGIITSAAHRIWARSQGSTLETRSRYTPTDCFETFPLPNRNLEQVAVTMEDLHYYRAALMLATERGVTATYNRVHTRAEAEPGVLSLRELHSKLDDAVLTAYGWSDVNLDHDFRDTEEGLRFTISESARVELLDRLLELNHVRHAEEVANGAASATGRRKANGGRRISGGEGAQAVLLEPV